VTWRRVDPYFARRIQLAAFVIGVLFGLDYLFTPVGSSAILTYVERTWVPLWAWGATIMLAGTTGLIIEGLVLSAEHPLVPTAKRWQWGWASNIAHILLVAIFAVLTCSSVVDIIDRGWDTGQWYGWRTTIMWGGFVYANWQFVRRLGDPL
jgi:hypothetical protein